ncbi:hypothetical protein FE257_009798 [Aspergillus nanangensis]|uniref:Uncharacterized protein n=1 Tax=Aspergillus nanangensis TaxID=2582783 RepID=A0AAD4CJA2_ASPNN|nr:hypothetical protein FE257_009798 [Aspergillus nanangensis]
MDADIGPNPEAFFRPVKRRKFLRRRHEEDSHDETPNEHESSLSAPQAAQEESNDAVHHSDIARLRRLHRTRKGGIEFSATSRPTAENGKQVAISTAEDMDFERAHAMSDRFTAHTGQTVDVDKHMYEPSHLFYRIYLACNGD